MMFWCSPPKSKCEWSRLRPFVEEYNRTYGTSYYLEACLDVANRETPEPEWLLKSRVKGERPMVIEHKSVVWPNKHLANHSNEHVIADRVRGFLKGPYGDSLHLLTLKANDLKGQRQETVRQWADEIAGAILANEDRARSLGGIRALEPIPWRFRPLPPRERHDDAPRAGVEVQIEGEWIGLSRSCDSSEDLATAMVGFAHALQGVAHQCVPKFEKYGHCIRLLLLQFYGEDSLWMEEDAKEIIRSAHLPISIDQVWLGEPEWVSEDDYEICWSLARGSVPSNHVCFMVDN